MVPHDGNALLDQAPPLEAADWKRLSNCLWDSGETECGYQPLYTPCPAPGDPTSGDPAAPVGFSAMIAPLSAWLGPSQPSITVRWAYRNSLGGVTLRDDVRLDLAIAEHEIPGVRTPPAPSEFPTIHWMRQQSENAGEQAVVATASRLIIRNASYMGHHQFTEPSAAPGRRSYRIDWPARCGHRYLLRLLPKQFCFDQSKIAYGLGDHRLYLDLPCS